MNRRSLNEIIQAAKVAASKLGFIATGRHEQREKYKRYFEVQSGNKIAWTSVERLEKGISPFRNPSKTDLQKEVKELAAKHGGIFTGNTKPYIRPGGETGPTLYEVSNKDQQIWVSISTLKKSKDLFRNTFTKQMKEVEQLAMKIGAVATGNNKKISAGKYYKTTFELVKDGRVRWSNLGNLRAGFDPFQVRNLLEVTTKAEDVAREMGLIISIPPKQKNVVDATCEVMRLSDNKKITTNLLNLSNGHNPFFYLTEEERHAAILAACEKIGVKFTGKIIPAKGRGTKNKYEVTLNGEFAIIEFSRLLNLTNPFRSGGFDNQMPGSVYVYKIWFCSDEYIGYGITNSYENRKIVHAKNLANFGATWEELIVVNYEDGKKCQEAELKIKNETFLKPLDLIGFRTESTSTEYLPRILEIISKK